MKRRSVLLISLFALLANTLSACVTSLPFYAPPIEPTTPKASDPKLPESTAATPPQKAERPPMVSLEITLDRPQAPVTLWADVHRPHRRIEPKTLIILAPGAGNVSRKGEISSDGVNTYPEAVEQNTLWAQALADAGMFVLTYDKRTCTKAINPACADNPQTDINTEGIAALAKDLDGIYRYTFDRFLGDEAQVRVILMSQTQGAQVLSHSAAAKVSSGIIVLSPVVGDMAESWTAGLMKAAEAEKGYTRKNNLRNQSESTKRFFASLREGHFSNTANVRGASVAFWQSWVKASFDTLPKLISLNTDTLLLFNKSDVFSSQALVDNITHSARNHPKIKIKTSSAGDRNFIESKALAKAAINDVIEFIKKAPAAKPLAPLP